MKKIFLTAATLILLNSCQKIEETVNSTGTSAKEKAQQKANDLVQETVNEQLNKIVKSEAVAFDSVFPHQNQLVIENQIGKKATFPNGSPFYVFKYKTSDRDLLLNTLVEQPTTDEAKSSKEFSKVDGASIVEKITFFEKFLPANTVDFSFLEEIKNDRNIEYYKIKRFPHASTIIYNPKNNMVYQFVEVKK